MLCLICIGELAISAQEPVGKSPVNSVEKPVPEEKQAEKAQLPYQIQLLDTHIRFETNGDSRKDVHTIVKINDLLGARQFARLAFDYNRAFQQVEIPMVRVTHANGGTSEVLPSAISDTPNPAVEKYPAYQDVRVKSVRILGLQEGDTIEYRVITTTTHHPLAPDFWLEHSFDRSGQVLEEHYELDLPGHVNSVTDMRVLNGSKPLLYLGIPSMSFQSSNDGKEERSIYGWKIVSDRKLPASVQEDGVALPDVIVTSFGDWMSFSLKMAAQSPSWTEADRQETESRLKYSGTSGAASGKSLPSLYHLVAQKVATVDLPTGANGYKVRHAKEIFETGYATPIEKCFLLARLAQWAGLRGEVLLSGSGKLRYQFPRPSAFDHVFAGVTEGVKSIAFDPGVEVAPFGVIAAQFRGKEVLTLSPHDHGDYFDAWTSMPEGLPFRAFQKVAVDSNLGEDGKLTAKVKYTLRGDNELMLRVAFHQTVKEKWKDVAGLLALSDGFRGVITGATVSDPMATKEPFTVEYELTQPKFVDWSKKPVRIPALLPQIGLPDNSTKSSGNGIELGTPLDVETTETLHLPAGTTVQAPAGTAVQRDYATYTSKYGATPGMLTALRHIRFLEQEVAAHRIMDYSAFVRAVQNDQAQYFMLDRRETVKAAQ
jgi:hypothetical protein